ncbi:MAG TPA: hypothetical protein VHO01_02195 [Jatrophihabitans sp.]|nr:hypothetical protein [Jatrophihabitans sp.]
MFEEVPRARRGLAAYLGVSRLTARRIVLGPFVVGGGVALAAVGGSVAVAATAVFTASSIRASDLPPHPHPQPPVVAASPARFGAVPQAARTLAAAPAPAPATSSTAASSARPSSTPQPSAQASRSTAAAPAHSTEPRASATSAATSTPSPSSTASPDGNATVYVSGWNAQTKQLVYEFASVSIGTGPQHSDVYSVTSDRQYTAGLAADVRVVSGGRLCPPAGSSCTVDQLIAGAVQGFYAELAIGPSGVVHQVLERDNANQYAPSLPQPSPSTSTPPATGPAPASPSAAPQPTA